MSFDDVAIHIGGVSKRYEIYDQPRDRLKQFILPRLRKAARLPHRNHFHEFWALRDISFDVRKGETVGIVGRNGSGKSTLLQIVCGTLAPTTGSVTASGRIAALLELGSGFNPEFTGRENVYLNGALLGLSREEIDARFENIAAFADIGEFIEQPVKIYSSGMMVRLAFAVAINVDPQILIVDEALSVGDERFQRKCFSRIESIKNAGATILFVSHSSSAIIELCDRAVLFDDGELLTIGRSKVIVGKYQRLLYAPADKRVSIRDAIKTIPDEIPVARGAIGEDGDVPASSPPGMQAHEEYFDPGLKPQSTIEYERRGCAISSPRLMNEDGLEVNNLIVGNNYHYTYDVAFSAPAKSVRFGMMVKTKSGIELAGILSHPEGEGIDAIDAEQRFKVTFRFAANLNPGVYFLNAGVTGKDSKGDEDHYLHRVLDALMVRIAPRKQLTTSGHANLAVGVYRPVHWELTGQEDSIAQLSCERASERKKVHS